MSAAQEYRKTATVFARQAKPGETVRVQTMEGPAVAKPGDWILTANTSRGESWVIDGATFTETYEPVGGPSAATTGGRS